MLTKLKALAGQRALLANTALRGLGNIAFAGVKFVITILLARKLGRSDFARFAVTLGAVDGLLLLLNLGLPTGVTYYASRQDAATVRPVLLSFLRTRLIINVAATAVAALVIALLALWGTIATSTVVLAVVGCCLYNVLSLQMMMDGYYMGSSRFGRYLFAGIVPKEVLTIGGAVFFIYWTRMPIVGVLGAMTGATLLLVIAALVGVAVGKGEALPVPPGDVNGEALSAAQRRALPTSFMLKYWPTAVASIFFGWLLVPAVGLFYGMAAAANFTVCFRIVNIPLMVIPVGIAAIPFLGKVEDAAALRSRMLALVGYTVAAFVALAGLTMLFAGDVLALFGGKYTGLAWMVYALAPIMVLRAVRDVMLPAYIRMDRMTRYSLISIAITVMIAVAFVVMKTLGGFLAVFVSANFVGVSVMVGFALRRVGQGLEAEAS